MGGFGPKTIEEHQAESKAADGDQAAKNNANVGDDAANAAADHSGDGKGDDNLAKGLNSTIDSMGASDAKDGNGGDVLAKDRDSTIDSMGASDAKAGDDGGAKELEVDKSTALDVDNALDVEKDGNTEHAAANTNIKANDQDNEEVVHDVVQELDEDEVVHDVVEELHKDKVVHDVIEAVVQNIFNEVVQALVQQNKVVDKGASRGEQDVSSDDSAALAELTTPAVDSIEDEVVALTDNADEGICHKLNDAIEVYWFEKAAWVPGSIVKVHERGDEQLFDIEYIDRRVGEIEINVPASNIRQAGSDFVSPDPNAGPSRRMSRLSMPASARPDNHVIANVAKLLRLRDVKFGDKMQCRYRQSNEFFPATVTKSALLQETQFTIYIMMTVKRIHRCQG